MNWDECVLHGVVKKIKPDTNLIGSLIEQSRRKLLTDDFSPMNADTASTKFSNNYDSLREVLEALAVKFGYKIYNHDCFFGFLKQVLHLEKESFAFDTFRKIRNSVNYYGSNLSPEKAALLIKEIRELRELLLKRMV